MIIAVSTVAAGLLHLFGLGWLVAGRARRGTTSLLEDLPISLVWGLILNYALVLVCGSLATSLTIGCGAALLGLFDWSRRAIARRRLGANVPGNAGDGWRWLAVVVATLLNLSPIVAVPLSAWDARSIWFFHAKMLYAAGELGAATGFQHPSVAFSHADYPKLVPVLAAQVAVVTGHWNEYLPKLSLLFLLIPLLAWVAAAARLSLASAFLVGVCPSLFHGWLWNGYMDGYLAAYFGLALLLFGRYVVLRRAVDLYASLSCLLLLPHLKLEGALASLAAIGAITAGALLTSRGWQVERLRAAAGDRAILLAVAAGLFPLIAWKVHLRAWGIGNALQIGTQASFDRIAARLAEGSYAAIADGMFAQLSETMFLMALAAVAIVRHGPKPGMEVAVPWMAGGAYLIGLVLVYLLTPLDLAWHLETSVDRTVLAVKAAWLVGCYFVVDGLEERATEHGPDRTSGRATARAGTPPGRPSPRP